jgi:hypothetical protein
MEVMEPLHQKFNLSVILLHNIKVKIPVPCKLSLCDEGMFWRENYQKWVSGQFYALVVVMLRTSDKMECGCS